MAGFLFQIKKDKLWSKGKNSEKETNHQEEGLMNKGKAYRNVDMEKALRVYHKLGWIGLLVSFAVLFFLIYRPLTLEVAELESRQIGLAEKLKAYKAFSPSEEIPGSERLPEILEQSWTEIKREGVEIKSVNVEKFVSSSIPQTDLGYALVRVHLKKVPNIPETLQKLEEIKGRRIIIAEIRQTQSETNVLLEIYFDPIAKYGT